MEVKGLFFIGYEREAASCSVTVNGRSVTVASCASQPPVIPGKNTSTLKALSVGSGRCWGGGGGAEDLRPFLHSFYLFFEGR